jgi:putative membrane protein
MTILVTWVALTLAMWLSARLLPSMEIRGGVGTHLLVSGAFGLLLFLTGWLFHLILGVATFGLLFIFGFVARVIVGAIVLKLLDAFTKRLRVRGFGTALLAALIISVVGSAAEALMYAL